MLIGDITLLSLRAKRGNLVVSMADLHSYEVASSLRFSQ